MLGYVFSTGNTGLLGKYVCIRQFVLRPEIFSSVDLCSDNSLELWKYGRLEI